MVASADFWLVLAGAAAVFWLLPARFRMAFLAGASAAYVITGELLKTKNDMLIRLGGVWLLGFCAIFFLLVPLAARRAKAMAARAAAGRQRMLQAKSESGASTLVLEYPPAPIPNPYWWVLPALVLAALAYLAAFKYILPNLISRMPTRREAILIPLGISYFTFKLIHYAIEVARGNIKDRSPWQFLCWVFLFPTYSAGPIERFDHFLASQDSQLRLEAIAEGLARIIYGLIKKFFIAEMLLGAWYTQSAGASLLKSGISTPRLWGLAVASYLWLYMDFSGYCDIAIGAVRLFGIRIMENFDWPVFSPNIGAFWKRWHMTLAGWCQSYIYMPVLGLTRSTVLALYATFVVIGLWHVGSLPWLAWGLYNATGLYVFSVWMRFRRQRKWTALDKAPWKFIGVPITFLFVSAGEVLTFGCVKSGSDMLRLFARLFFIDVGA